MVIGIFFEKIAYLEPKITKKGKCTNLALPFAGRAAKNLAFCEPFLAQRDSSIAGSSPGGGYAVFYDGMGALFCPGNAPLCSRRDCACAKGLLFLPGFDAVTFVFLPQLPRVDDVFLPHIIYTTTHRSDCQKKSPPITSRG